MEKEPISIRIPEILLKEFGKDLRVVYGGFINGIPAPERILSNSGLLKELYKDFEIVLTPRQMMK